MDELIAKLVEANAKTEAWVAEDPTNRWAGLYSVDPQHWIDRGINNLADFDRNELETAYYELYKDANGFRPRDFKVLTNDELQSEIDYLSKKIARQIEEQNARQEMNVTEFEQRIQDTIDLMNGCSRYRAIEIIAEAEGLTSDFEFYGYECLEYHFNLPYGYLKSKEG